MTIEGVALIELKRIADERGAIFHMLRSDAPHFHGFGEVYFSSVHPGAIKAWHLQRRAFRHYAVPLGAVRVVLFDPRPGSPTTGAVQEVELGERDYRLLVIPPRIWSGFTGIGGGSSLVADCMDLPFDPAQAERKDPADPAIPYRWRRE
jgi:dTDP-4-dehydrorhamnose 3,5-epimerase